MTFGYEYEGYDALVFSRKVYKGGSKHAVPSGENTTVAYHATSRRLPGIGFAGTIAVPITMNIRPYKGIAPYVQLAPGCYFENSRYIDPRTEFIANFNVGLRFGRK